MWLETQKVLIIIIKAFHGHLLIMHHYQKEKKELFPGLNYCFQLYQNFFFPDSSWLSCCSWCLRHIFCETTAIKLLVIATNLEKICFGWVVVYQSTLHLPFVPYKLINVITIIHMNALHRHALLPHTHMYNTYMIDMFSWLTFLKQLFW